MFLIHLLGYWPYFEDWPGSKYTYDVLSEWFEQSSDAVKHFVFEQHFEHMYDKK